MLIDVFQFLSNGFLKFLKIDDNIEMLTVQTYVSKKPKKSCINHSLTIAINLKVEPC